MEYVSFSRSGKHTAIRTKLASPMSAVLVEEVDSHYKATKDSSVGQFLGSRLLLLPAMATIMDHNRERRPIAGTFVFE